MLPGLDRERRRSKQKCEINKVRARCREAERMTYKCNNAPVATLQEYHKLLNIDSQLGRFVHVLLRENRY